MQEAHDQEFKIMQEVKDQELYNAGARRCRGSMAQEC